MVRRDYQLLTDVLKDRLSETNIMYMSTNNDEYAYRHFEGRAIVEMLADALAQDNKAFDKDKFINDIRGQL